MWVLKLKDRGRDLAVHQLDNRDEADEIRRVYELLGYDPVKIIVKHVEGIEKQAA